MQGDRGLSTAKTFGRKLLQSRAHNFVNPAKVSSEKLNEEGCGGMLKGKMHIHMDELGHGYELVL